MVKSGMSEAARGFIVEIVLVKTNFPHLCRSTASQIWRVPSTFTAHTSRGGKL